MDLLFLNLLSDLPKNCVDEDILKRDIARILRKLEELQAEKAEQASSKKEKPVELSPKEHGEAMLLLEDH